MYLDLTRNNPNRKALVELRISNHKLKTETDRYDEISRGERLCSVCGLFCIIVIIIQQQCGFSPNLVRHFIIKLSNFVVLTYHKPIDRADRQNSNQAKCFQNALTYCVKTASHENNDCPLLCNHYSKQKLW